MWILPHLNGSRQKGNAAIYKRVFPFTNHQITLQVFPSEGREIDNHRTRWFTGRELESIPIPSPHRRAIEQLLANA